MMVSHPLQKLFKCETVSFELNAFITLQQRKDGNHLTFFKINSHSGTEVHKVKLQIKISEFKNIVHKVKGYLRHENQIVFSEICCSHGTLCSCRCLLVPEDDKQQPSTKQAERYQDAYCKKYWKTHYKCQDSSKDTSQNPPKWAFFKGMTQAADGDTPHVIAPHHLK